MPKNPPLDVRDDFESELRAVLKDEAPQSEGRGPSGRDTFEQQFHLAVDDLLESGGVAGEPGNGIVAAEFASSTNLQGRENGERAPVSQSLVEPWALPFTVGILIGSAFAFACAHWLAGP